MIRERRTQGCTTTILRHDESVAKLFRKRSGEPPEFLDMKEVGEFLAGGKAFMGEVRNAYIDTFEFTNKTFVDGLRLFLSTFRMPGESMLIERLMTVFARRYYECNPGFVTHLSSGKVDELKGAYDKFKRENAEGKALGL